MCKLIICDGDGVAAHQLRSMIARSECGRGFELTCVPSVAELERCLRREGEPDILLTAIHFNTGDGVEAVGRLLGEHTHTQVIYTTEQIEDCTRVYETRHVYFLVKPIGQRELDLALSAALRNLHAEGRSNLALKTGDAVFSVPLAEIMYMESSQRKVTIHTSRRDYEVGEKLSTLAELCGGSMIRCHQSYCVNPIYAEALQGNFFELKNGVGIPISRHRLKESREAFISWIENRS